MLTINAQTILNAHLLITHGLNLYNDKQKINKMNSDREFAKFKQDLLVSKISSEQASNNNEE